MEKKLSVREMKKEKTKLTLVNKAVQLFSEKGFENIGMRQLAAESSLGLGTYYNYFKSKDEIIFSIFDNIFADILAVDKKPQYSNESFEADFSTFIYSRLELLEEHKSVLLNYVQTVSNPKHFLGEKPVGLISTRKSLGLFWMHIMGIMEAHNIELSEEDKAILPKHVWHQFITYLYIFCIEEYGKDEQDNFIDYTIRMIGKMITK